MEKDLSEITVLGVDRVMSALDSICEVAKDDYGLSPAEVPALWMAIITGVLIASLGAIPSMEIRLFLVRDLARRLPEAFRHPPPPTPQPRAT